MSLIKKYSLEKSTWTYKGFHGVLHTFFPVGQTGPAMQDFFGQHSKTIFIVKDDYVHWYWNDEELTSIREKFLERLKKDKDYLETLKKDWKKEIKLFEDILLKIDKTDFKELSDDELCSLYKEFYEGYIGEFKYFMVLGDAISMHSDRYLEPEFKKILKDDFNSDFPKLLATKYLSFVEEEALERQEIAESLVKNGKIEQNALKEHADKFFYVYNNYAKGDRIDAKDFEKIIKDDITKGIEETKDHRAELIKEKNRLIKKHKLSDWHQTLLYIIDEFFHIQDMRKKYVLISNYYQFEFLREVARRTGTDLGLLKYSIYPEFKDVLGKKIDADELKKRKEICVCVNTLDSYELATGDEASEVLDFFQKENVDDKELKGFAASVGKAKGRVKKILKIHDMANMEQGDILVSSMTRPEMAVAMKRAAAIITDEGGITSHAAIVSREMGIPCIIGTKKATQLLKDGDIVEVDADEGLVRIIDSN